MQNKQDKSLTIAGVSLYINERRKDLATFTDGAGELLENSSFRHQILSKIWDMKINIQVEYAEESVPGIVGTRTCRFLTALYLLREEIMLDKWEKALFRPIGVGFDEQIAEIDLLLDQLPNIGRMYYVPLRSKVSASLMLIRRKQEIGDDLTLQSILSELVTTLERSVYESRGNRDAPDACTRLFRQRLHSLRQQAEEKGWEEKITEIDAVLAELLLPTPDPSILDQLIAAKLEAKVHAQFPKIASDALKELREVLYHMGYTEGFQFIEKALTTWGIALKSEPSLIERNLESYRVHYDIWRAAISPIWLARR